MTPASDSNGRYFRQGLLAAAILIAVDQLSKWWILEVFNLPEKQSVLLLPFFSLTMVWNKGISMGLPLGESLGKWGIIVLTGGITVWLVIWLRRSARLFEAAALTLIIGGAVGNVIDRFIHGAVVDFIHLHAYGYSFYVFNVADSAISIGVVMLLIDSLRDGDKSPKKVAKGGQAEPDRKGDQS